MFVRRLSTRTAVSVYYASNSESILNHIIQLTVLQSDR